MAFIFAGKSDMSGQFWSKNLSVRCHAFCLALLVLLAPMAPAFGQDAFATPTNVAVAVPGPVFGVPFVELSLKSSATPASTLQQTDSIQSTNSTPLAPERLDALLKGLPPLPVHDKQSFALPEQALVKPPPAGMQTVDKFPPVQSTAQPYRQPSAAKAQPAALRILRVAPQGAVASAEQIAVTFSQPMVPLSEAVDVDTSAFLKLQPQPAGHWRWAGTQTLIFTPARADHRLPAATSYSLSFPGHLKSVVGGAIKGTPHFSFKTPALEAVLNYPVADEPTVASPVILLTFNQEINKQELLSHMTLRDKSHSYPLRLVTADQLSAEAKNDGRLDVKDMPANTWIAVKPALPLPLGIKYLLTLAAGSPSAEGTDRTLKPQSFDIQVHGPLSLTDHPKNGMTAGSANCSFGFNNNFKLDNQKLESLIKISPRPANCEIAGNYNGFYINGDFKAFQKYTVTLDAGLKDAFNQKLGHLVTCSWTTGARDAQLTCNNNFVTIAPGQKPVLSFFAQATDKVTAKIYRVTPKDIASDKNFDFVDNAESYASRSIMPGELVATKVYPVGINAVSVDVDLAPYLKDGHGQFIIACSCPDKINKTILRFASFVQVTAIGIDVFKGSADNFRVFTTSLSDGKPLAGCSVTLPPLSNASDTDSNGQTTVMVPSNTTAPPDPSYRRLLTVVKGTDAAVLVGTATGWVQEPTEPTINYYCVTDRALYRPGDQVHVKGWQRGFKLNQDSAIRLFASNITHVNCVATSSDGTKIVEGNAKVDAAGGFDFTVNLPAKIALGGLNIDISAPQNELAAFCSNGFVNDAVGNSNSVKNYSKVVQVDVQEFRRPDFEMKNGRFQDQHDDWRNNQTDCNGFLFWRR